MVARVSAYPIHWHGRIFRDRGHGLDAHIKFAGDPHIYFYQLDMPPISTSAGLSPDDPYPSPVQYYLATGKRFVCRWTLEEYEATGHVFPGPMAPGDVGGVGTGGAGGTMADESVAVPVATTMENMPPDSALPPSIDW